MPNNFVFNQSAEDFKVQIYGVQSSVLTPIQINANGGLDVAVVNTPTVVVSGVASVALDAVAVASDIATVTASALGTVLAEDTSQQKQYSFYINNDGAPAMSVFLQVAPVDEDALYMNDTDTAWQVPESGKVVVSPKNYLHFTRLYFDTGTASNASFIAYYNTQL